MAKEKPTKSEPEEQAATTDVPAVTPKSTARKKKKDETAVKTEKTTKTKAPKESSAKKPKDKAEKQEKTKGKEEDQKPSKEDKSTKFLVSMKKSLRKSLKKEAAEAGVSMNDYIVSAVEQKLLQDAAKG